MVDILVRNELIKITGLRNKEIIFQSSTFGKPFLSQFPNIHFNMSHSGEWAVCIIGNQPVGIDIEKIQPIDFSSYSSFFSITEYNDLSNKNHAIKLEYFFDLWTLKESYLKAIGTGFYHNPTSFTIRPNKEKNSFILEDDPYGYTFKQYSIDNNYKLSVCSKSDIFNNRITRFSLNELYTEFISRA